MTIITRKNRIPWSWVVFLALPGVVQEIVWPGVAHPATVPALRKVFDTPAAMNIWVAANFAILLAGVFIAYQSDRVWTRWGRRKPFIVAGWIGLILSLILTLQTQTVWVLGIAILAAQAFTALMAAWTPLYYEVTPLPQRGRAQALSTLIGQGAALFLSVAIVKQFSKESPMSVRVGLGRAWGIHGEQIFAWTAVALAVLMTLALAYNIKESPAPGRIVGERFSLGGFVRSVFGERQWLLIYLLVFAQIALNQGLGPMGALMITKQFGYSKAQLGLAGSWAAMAKWALPFVILWAGFLADKRDRLKLFWLCLVLSALHHILYWTYIHALAPGHVPPIAVVAAFDVFGTFVNAAGAIFIVPLLFDYVPRDRMGTVCAGISLVRGVLKLVTANSVGVWINGYSGMFMPPGKFDYSSGLLYTTMLGVLGILACGYFARQRRIGRVIEYGRLELENGTKPATQ